MLVVFTGGARSGKSSAAVDAATALAAPVAFIATAEAGDAEMAARIERHRAERPAGWTTLEAPHDLDGAVRSVGAESTIVIDCLAIWLSDRLLADETNDLADELMAEVRRLGTTLRERRGASLVVTNEVGAGVVPASALGRRFRDLLGLVNQVIVAESDRAFLVVAGRMLELADPRAQGVAQGSGGVFP